MSIFANTNACVQSRVRGMIGRQKVWEDHLALNRLIQGGRQPNMLRDTFSWLFTMGHYSLQDLSMAVITNAETFDAIVRSCPDKHVIIMFDGNTYLQDLRENFSRSGVPQLFNHIIT